MGPTCATPAASGAGSSYATRFIDLARALGELGVWVRLHYVYPYPHVDEVIPLMAERRVLPYLDIPFQHGSPSVLKRMRRPAHAVDTLERIHAWREQCPDLTLRSTFIVGFPGRDRGGVRGAARRGWTRRSSIASAASSTHRSRARRQRARRRTSPPEVQEERYARFMERAAQISAQRLARASAARLRCWWTRWRTIRPSRAARRMPRRSTAWCGSQVAAPCAPVTGRRSPITAADAYDLTGRLAP